MAPAQAPAGKKMAPAHTGTAGPAIYLPLAGPSYQPATMQPRAGTVGQGYGAKNASVAPQVGEHEERI